MYTHIHAMLCVKNLAQSRGSARRGDNRAPTCHLPGIHNTTNTHHYSGQKIGPLLIKTHPQSILQVPTTQLAKVSIDLKFVELTADVLEIFFIKYPPFISFSRLSTARADGVINEAIGFVTARNKPVVSTYQVLRVSSACSTNTRKTELAQTQHTIPWVYQATWVVATTVKSMSVRPWVPGTRHQ